MSRWLRASLVLLTVALVAPNLAAQDATSFYRGFFTAWQKKDFPQKRKLITENRKVVFAAFRLGETEYCSISLKNEEEGKKYLEFLNEMAYMHELENRDKYLRTRLKWVESLSKEQKQAKLELWQSLGKGYPLLQKAFKTRSDSQYREALAEYERMAEHAEKAGDHFWLVNAYMVQAQLYDRMQSYYESAYYFVRAQDAARKGNVRDLPEVQNYQIRRQLDEVAKKPRPPLSTDAMDVSIPVEESKAKYEKALQSGEVAKASAKELPKEIGEMPPLPNVHEGVKIEWKDQKGFRVRPMKRLPVQTHAWADNLHWFFWPGFFIDDGKEEGVGIVPGTATMNNDGGKLFLKREGQRVPERIKVTTRPEQVEFRNVKYKDGSEGRIWHELMKVPNNVTFNGFQWRSGGSRGVAVRVRGATAAIGEIEGQTVTIFDSSANGSFNDKGQDSLIIGKGRRAESYPLSNVIELDGKFWELRVEPNGRELRVRPFTGPVAPLKLEWSGAPRSRLEPAFLIAKRTEDDVFIDLMRAHDKFIWVPAGTYQFVRGYMMQGKGMRAKSMLIGPGRQRTFEVAEGEANVWQMGGAGEGYSFEFKTSTERQRGREVIMIPGREIKIFGAFGEEYLRTMFGQPTPRVYIAKSGSEKPLGVAEMRRPGQSDLNESIDAMWYPQSLEMPKPFRGDYQVKMEANYPPLGKISSAWVAGK